MNKTLQLDSFMYFCTINVKKINLSKMKALKISALLAALAAVFTFSSCLNDDDTNDVPRFTSYVTITGDATFGYTFHSDFGCTLKPTAASIQEVLPGLSQANVKRAVVAFDLLNDSESTIQLEAGKTYDIVLRSYYYANYAVPTYQTLDVTGNTVATDTLTANDDRIIAIDDVWAINGFVNANLTLLYDNAKTFYLNTYYDYEKDIDVDNSTMYLNLYYNHNSTNAINQGKSVFCFDLPEEVAYEFMTDSIDLVLRAVTEERGEYREAARCRMAVEDFFIPMY